MSRLLLSTLALCATLLLAGCDSPEEKAEGYYQSALALMADGDVERAMVELRNVFRYDGFHQEARQLYADTLLERGDPQEAYGQYMRLIEQYPDLLDVRLTLADLAMSGNNWDEVQRHGSAAIALAPDDPRVRALSAALAYRDAALAGDPAAQRAAAEDATAVLADQPDSRIARRIVIDSLLTGDDPQAALPQLDVAIEAEPELLDLQVTKFRLLNQTDQAAAEAQLERMFELFPDNPEVRQTLIAWYLGREDLDQAEALLRELAGADDAEAGGHVALVQFLSEARSPEAARDELDRLVAANEGSERADLYRSIRASMDFDAGARDEAIAELQEIIDGAEPSDQRRGFQTTLARMLIATGNPVGARAMVEEVLEEDTTNVDALKLRAAWAIQEDRPGDAINDLRAALNQAPRDADTMTLMAEAHERDGSFELAGERLALAVEVSGNAPAESLRYARFLMGQDRAQTALSVVEDGLRVSPQNIELIGLFAQIALDMQDWNNVDRALASLDGIDNPQADRLATDLRTARLMGQDRTEETVAALEAQIAQGGDDATRATAMLALTRFREGDAAGARTVLDEAIAATPDDIGLRMLSGSMQLAMNETDAAEATFRDVLADAPGTTDAVTQLHALLVGLGRPDEAAEVLEAGLAAAPDSRPLRVMQAGQLEAQDDIDGAIALYEALYAEDSSNVIVANNLASLIGTHVADPEQLDRAAAIARRLRGREIPAFQDTYGWIEYRRGNLEEALAELEPAARGLPDDPLVRFHLGMTYVALDRPDEARRELQAALDGAEGSPLPQFDTARETLAGLDAPGPEATEGDATGPDAPASDTPDTGADTEETGQ